MDRDSNLASLPAPKRDLIAEETKAELPRMDSSKQQVSILDKSDNQSVSSKSVSQKQSPEDKPVVKAKIPRWKLKSRKFLNHYITVIVMTLITIYALFFDDIRVIAFTKKDDDVFYGLTLLGMIAFLWEIIMASLVAEDYWLSFFFWLDLVSTVSMIPDCGWIWDPLTGGNEQSNATDLAKTSRAGRVTKVIRVIRLIRLIRIVKLYKQAKLAREKAQNLNLANTRRFLNRKSVGPNHKPSLNDKHTGAQSQRVYPMSNNNATPSKKEMGKASDGPNDLVKKESGKNIGGLPDIVKPQKSPREV